MNDQPEGTITTTHGISVAPNRLAFKWRAIVLTPKFIPGWKDYSIRQKIRMSYGWDIFFYKVPVLKVAALLNAAVAAVIAWWVS